MYLTARGAVAAAVIAGAAAVCAVLLGMSAPILVLAADGVLLALVLSDVAQAPPPRSVAPRRIMADLGSVGRVAPVTIEVRNPGRRALVVAVRDATPPSMQRSPRAHVLEIPPSGLARAEAEIRPQRRGRIELGPITVRTAGPLRLAGRQTHVPSPGWLKVYPALPGRAEVDLRLERARLLQSGERSSAVRGGGAEFDALREYHPDDEFRRINWRATARAAKPMSNVFREERNQQVLLLLDAGRMMAGSVGGVPRFEHAIDAAVAVAELAARVGDHVGMACFDRDLVATVAPRSGRAQPGRILEALFTVSPTLDAPNYARAFTALLDRWHKRALLVLITELIEETAIEPLLHALPSLLQRHLVVIGSVIDPEVDRLARVIPDSSEEAYLKAAAAGTLDARARAAERLQRLGAVVVDRAPGELAGALADAYLRIKALGRL